MFRFLLSLFFPTAFAVNTQDLKNYIQSNPVANDPDFQKGIINVGLPTVNTNGIANPQTGEIALKDSLAAGQSLLAFIFLTLFKVIGALALGGVIWNIGVIVSSFGNAEKIKKAIRGILWSLAGLILALLSHAAITALAQYLLRGQASA